ncbi:hypothetical protein HYX03_03195 [Candidatus Woesearchaeota archaeon]|nr:hypothetical protein [Candidatus Woesearchaeota archaeon]
MLSNLEETILNTDGFDNDGIIEIPQQIINKLRKPHSTNKFQLYYRLYKNDYRDHIELFAHLPLLQVLAGKLPNLINNFPFLAQRCTYQPVDVSQGNYIQLPLDYLGRTGITINTKVAFIGYNNRIIIYNAETYKSKEDFEEKVYHYPGPFEGFLVKVCHRLFKWK